LVLKLWREYELTVFMVTHDLHEGFFLGTRLWVFDKMRVDPHAPNAYGANITYDLPVGEIHTGELQKIENDVYPSKVDLRQALSSQQ
jgi:NitT/TauT family transport system ATP-binding protein